MAVNLEHIQFQGIIFDASNTLISEYPIHIQFYNVNLKSWLSLTEKSIVLKKSKFLYELEIPDRISTSNQTMRIVREVLKSGGIPSFRIVKESKEDIIEVIARSYTTTIQQEKEIVNINFGEHWILNKEAFIQKDDHVIIASSFPVFEMSSTLESLKEEREKFNQDKAKLSEEIEGLNTTITTLSKEKEEIENSVITKDTAINELNKSIALLQTKLNEEISAKEELTTATISLRAQINEQQKIIADYEKEASENYKERFFALEKQVIKIEKEKNDLVKEKQAFLESVKKLQLDTEKYKDIIKEKDAELSINQVLVTSLEQKTEKLREELEEARSYNQTEHPNKLAASKVYGSIVNDVIKADEELANSRFKLANVSLNLKTTVEKGPEGTLLGLLDFESAKGINGAAVSDISIDIVPNNAAVVSNGLKMPNILGLTETAVRKVLLDYGLKLDAVYHATDNQNLVEGQSFKQSPAPEATIEEGQEVIVIFAKSIK